MYSATIYKNAVSYLKDCEDVLMKKEIINNLILGVAYSCIQENKQNKSHQFLNAFEGNEIMASSINTNSKAIIAGVTKKVDAIKFITDLYKSENTSLTGVIGESLFAEEFAKFYSGGTYKRKINLLYKLKNTNNIKISNGAFCPGKLEHFDELQNFAQSFYNETGLNTNQDTIRQKIKQYLKTNSIYTWMYNNQIVSIAAIVRRTKKTAAIGLVYTPKNNRGNGFASSCVKSLSDFIVSDRRKSSCLFTEKDNGISNNIYKKIGYNCIAEFSDISF